MIQSTSQLVLAPEASIDLHIHTSFSDGTWTPGPLLDYLRSEQIGLVAITDHDRTDTVAILQELALEKQLPVLVAVEMTCVWRDKMTDILCFGFDPGSSALNDLARDLINRQCENTREVYQNLQRQGYAFEQQPDELAALLEKPNSQQPHALVALLKKYGYGAGAPSAGQIVGDAGCAYASNQVAAVVDAAHRSGALALIAHPGRGDGFVTYDAQLLDELRQEAPLDGLEAYYPLHTPAQTAMYLDYAREHRLLTSSGSDSHGPEKKPIKYPAHLSRDLLERLGIRIA